MDYGIEQEEIPSCLTSSRTTSENNGDVRSCCLIVVWEESTLDAPARVFLFVRRCLWLWGRLWWCYGIGERSALELLRPFHSSGTFIIQELLRYHSQTLRAKA